jgi:polysaccharide export outer membrane protein
MKIKSPKGLQARSVFILLLIVFAGCVAKKKSMYFSDPKFSPTDQITIDNQNKNIYRLHKRDVLSVRIKTLDAESSSYFNIEKEAMYMNISPATTYLNGYSIDDNGNIEIPEAGSVNVEGLTIKEAEAKILKAVGHYLNKATIIVKLVSFKVTVLGEVRSPGIQYVYNDQVTIFEALGMSGDITEFGNRTNVNLIRYTPTGQNVVVLNLTEPRVLASEFLYLQPNDVLYVQPLKAKITRGNLSALTVASFMLSLVSTALLIFQSSN